MTFVLVGMPGSGKSCMSRAVGPKLKIKTLDADRVIESIHGGKKLHELINEYGVDGFRKIEEEALLSINEDNIILATGGSAIYYEKAMEHLKSLGKVIYLYISFETMLERIGDYRKRGIVIRPDQTIHDLYEERARLYEKYADITVNCDGRAYGQYKADLANVIRKCLKEEVK